MQRAIIVNEKINSFVFRFPIQWNNIREKYDVKTKLLRFYWCAVALKFVSICVATFLAIQALSNKTYHDGGNAGQLLFLTVTVLAVTSFADSVFIKTGYDVGNSFNWS